jgi:hypothetical protein
MSANSFSSRSRSGAVKEPPPAEPDFEVLPPEQPPGPGGKHREALAHLIAFVMDNLLRVPGTKARVGLNPILDVLPVFGDGAAALINAVTIFEGVRRGLPKIVLAHMGANVLLNALVGTVPVVGEIFAFWFKPSQRNYHLLLKHGAPAGKASARRTTTWQDWAFVFGLVAVMLLFLIGFVAVGLYVAAYMLHGLYSMFRW